MPALPMKDCRFCGKPGYLEKGACKRCRLAAERAPKAHVLPAEIREAAGSISAAIKAGTPEVELLAEMDRVNDMLMKFVAISGDRQAEKILQQAVAVTQRVRAAS